jgi:heterodisulfide reductase subunit B
MPPLSRAAKHGRGVAPNPEHQQVTYYPGCSLHGTAVEYDMSTRAVADKLALDLVEPDGWVCCGTTPAHSTDHVLSTVLPMKTLKCVEQDGQSCVTVPCPSCYIRMRAAMHGISAEPEPREQVLAEIDYIHPSWRWSTF